jgi:chromosome segregation ATPase
MPAFEQIRRDLDDSPGNLVKWEAACLKDVASLLESLERARTEWQSLSSQLGEAKAALAQERRVHEDLDRAREQLTTTRRDADGLREQAGRTAFAEAAAAAALERVSELERRVFDARAHTETAETDLVRTRERLVTVQRERDVLAENQQGTAELKAEAAELRTRLKRAEGARKELEEERDRAASIERELDRTRKDLVQAKKEGEEQMVLACDLRVKLNRLEKERDDAADHGKRKLRGVLEKVHEALDATGAPRGDDLSYGDRIRWLSTQLEKRGGAAS